MKRERSDMIKGVNRRIVEITGMDNDYFEKAVLYLRPDKSSSMPARIDLEARNAACEIISQENFPRKQKRYIIADITLRLLGIGLMLFSLSLIMYLFMM